MKHLVIIAVFLDNKLLAYHSVILSDNTIIGLIQEAKDTTRDHIKYVENYYGEDGANCELRLDLVNIIKL